MFAKILACLSALTLLTACEKIENATDSKINKVTFKGCSDVSTIETLVGIFDDQFNAGLNYNEETKEGLAAIRSQAKIRVEGIRTESINKDVGKYDCRAIMKFDLPPQGLEIFKLGPYQKIENSTFTRTQSGMEEDVSYTAQITDDGQNVYVEVAEPFNLAINYIYVYNQLKYLLPKMKSAAGAPAEQAGSDAELKADGCVISKMDAHRKAIGEDGLITAAQIGEWEEECRAGG